MRNLEAERLGGLEVDYQLEPGRLPYREFGGIRASENPVDDVRYLVAVAFEEVRGVAE